MSPSLASKVAKKIRDLYIFTWDALLTLINLFAPNLKPGSVIPHGSPGAGGKWPEFIPPKEGDSRSCCPALNALANHGILPRDGRNIRFPEMTHAVRNTYNFSLTFSSYVPYCSADFMNKNYSKDTFDLAEISLHNAIEHDASLTRQDVKFDPDQGKPHLPFINEVLASASGKDKEGNPLLTPADLSRCLGHRRAEARAANPDFSLSKYHKLVGSSNSSGLVTIFGGRIADLTPWLVEERIPEGWEPRVLSRMGMTLVTLNATMVFKIENAVKEETIQTSEI
ncbi:Chloroperoxidase [Mycena epipterygia]|nr:Chloroperoxidase [Mycena epipterygia]